MVAVNACRRRDTFTTPESVRYRFAVRHERSGAEQGSLISDETFDLCPDDACERDQITLTESSGGS